MYNMYNTAMSVKTAPINLNSNYIYLFYPLISRGQLDHQDKKENMEFLVGRLGLFMNYFVFKFYNLINYYFHFLITTCDAFF